MPEADGRESYFLISVCGLERQRSWEDTSRNKGAINCHFSPSSPNLNAEPLWELAWYHQHSLSNLLTQICPSESYLPQSWCCRTPPPEDQHKSYLVSWTTSSTEPKFQQHEHQVSPHKQTTMKLVKMCPTAVGNPKLLTIGRISADN